MIYRQFEDIPTGKYQIIMADPPWHFTTRSSKGQAKSPSQHYETHGVDWVKRLPVSSLAADDCLLWLWALNHNLHHAMEVMAAWGFEFKSSGHWAKYTKHGKHAFGTGYLLRGAGEPFLLGVRGKPKFGRSQRSVIHAKMGRHSEKPAEAFDAACRVFPSAEQRIELFSRQEREGWDVFGNEVE